MLVMWEYTVVQATGEKGIEPLVEQMNLYGKDRWEMYYINNGFLYFKRPIANKQ